MRLITSILYALGAALCCPEECCDGAVAVQVGRANPLVELPVIAAAAERNNCRGDDFIILLAIRKAENGRAGCEFGIKDPRAWDTCLDVQAGWAAATVVANRRRWLNSEARHEVDFITFLGDRYCPKSADPEGNKNWKKNVLYWFRKLR